MNSRHLVEHFEMFRGNNENCALVTVYETLGSTYSKAGSRMLITAGGERQGLVSGGCLEGDLAERARQVIESGASATVTYDLRDESDELFGLGVGCNGLIRVLIQPLVPKSAYEPMASIADVLLGKICGSIVTVIESELDAVSPGASLVGVGAEVRFSELPDSVASAANSRRLGAEASRKVSLADDVPGVRLLVAPLVPVPSVLILGAGPDAIPLIDMILNLGWRVTVADHRPGYLKRQGIERADRSILVAPGSLGTGLELHEFDAIVVMSHHLATDREYLRELADVSVPYLGLLGPPARKDRLLDDLGDDSIRLRESLVGPVGLDIGANSAESIAVSIAAQMQLVLAASTLR